MPAKSGGIANISAGGFTGAGAIVTLNLGFVPTKVEVYNFTGVIKWEKHIDMAASSSIKTVTAGTMTSDATSAIVINSDGTVTLSAALCVNAQVITWVAFA